MRVLAISGSLRSASLNSAFCRTVAQVAPSPFRVTVFPGLGELPLFNPDLEDNPPQAVRDFRARVDQADILLIASPEYAHGIPGVMKNALDWLVSHEPTAGKRVALINTSSHSHHAHEALREVLRTMSTVLIRDGDFHIRLQGSHVTEAAMLSSTEVRDAILRVFDALAAD